MVKAFREQQKRIIHPITAVLCVLLFLILTSGSLVIYNFTKQKNEVKASKPQNKIADSTKNVQGISTQDLATLENNDAGYTVKYPTNFDVLYAQDGVEFTPKQGQGKIVLKVSDGIVNVSIQSDGVNQSQLSNLNSASQTIKNTLQFIQPSPTDTANNKGRFSNIHFDPKKY